jgi:hypothetical protein
MDPKGTGTWHTIVIGGPGWKLWFCVDPEDWDIVEDTFGEVIIHLNSDLTIFLMSD